MNMATPVMLLAIWNTPDKITKGKETREKSSPDEHKNSK